METVMGFLLSCDTDMAKCALFKKPFSSLGKCEALLEEVLVRMMQDGLFPVFKECVVGALT